MIILINLNKKCNIIFFLSKCQMKLRLDDYLKVKIKLIKLIELNFRTCSLFILTCPVKI